VSAGGVEDGGADVSPSIAASFGVPEGVRRVFARATGATRIVLVRHGEAVCKVEGVVGGEIGCKGLTDLGRLQVRVLAERLESTGELADADVLYSSVLPRAVETAELLRGVLGDGAATIVERCDLCELHPGEADGMTWQEVIDNFGVPDWDTDPGHLIATGGESWIGFIARAGTAVQALAERHPGELVVAAVHAGVIEATLIHFLGIPPEAYRRGWVRIMHASLTEWEWAPKRSQWVLIRFNDAAGIPTA
jgi:2,3-bisphosphoglycerate-dependent phosphoglycerate mutase